MTAISLVSSSGSRSSAEQGPNALSKIIERLIECVAHPEGTEVPRQAYRLHTPCEGIWRRVRIGTAGIVQDLIPDVDGGHKAPSLPANDARLPAIIEDARARRCEDKALSCGMDRSSSQLNSGICTCVHGPLCRHHHR